MKHLSDEQIFKNRCDAIMRLRKFYNEAIPKAQKALKHFLSNEGELTETSNGYAPLLTPEGRAMLEAAVVKSAAKYNINHTVFSTNVTTLSLSAAAEYVASVGSTADEISSGTQGVLYSRKEVAVSDIFSALIVQSEIFEPFRIYTLEEMIEFSSRLKDLKQEMVDAELELKYLNAKLEN